MLYKGLKKDQPVCFDSDKSVEVYAAMLACIKIGAPYFFLDFESPIERKMEIIKISKPKLYLTSDSKFIKLEKSIDQYNINQFIRIKIKNNSNRSTLENCSSLASIAYYMFTSGSTGKPKGVIINQSNLQYLIYWARDAYKFNKKTRHSGLNPIYFDNSVFDFYATIFNGSTLLAVYKKNLYNPISTIKYLKKYKCTSWFSVPTLINFYLKMKVFKKNSLPNIKRFIFGGEGFLITRLKELYNIFGKKILYSNVYGPTETTCICSSYDVNSLDLKKKSGLPPIGYLHKYFDGFLWNNNKIDRKTGELVLRGPCVGQGYLNHDNINNKFQTVPFLPFEKIYFTGDIMKKDNMGKLFFLGRKDNQVKHRGYRIELEEIEFRIKKIKYIDDVIVYQKNIKNESQLIASIVLKKRIEKKLLYNIIKKHLPHFMIPTQIVFFDKFYVNKNGKVDRNTISNKADRILKS